MTDTETRQQIIDAAVKLLIQKGFANLNMNDIVSKSGISKGGVYWYFKTKDAIIEAVFASFLDAQLEFVDTTLSGDDPASASCGAFSRSRSLRERKKRRRRWNFIHWQPAIRR